MMTSFNKESTENYFGLHSLLNETRITVEALLAK